MEELIHVKPDISYEKALNEYIEEHEKYNSHMNGSGNLNRYKNNIKEYLKHLEEMEKAECGRLVPSETYMLIRKRDNYLIGMINIRRHLNRELEKCGGHIGYGIRPTERQKGYNKINLYLGIKRCQELGINMILLDCDKKNIGSSKTMEALGGKPLKEISTPAHPNAIRYAIDTNDSIKKYQKKYEGSKYESNRSK